MKSVQFPKLTTRLTLIHLGLIALEGLFTVGSLLAEPSKDGGILGFSAGRWAVIFVNLLALTAVLFVFYKMWTKQAEKLKTWLSNEQHVFWLFFLCVILFGVSLPAALGKIPVIRYFTYYGRIRPSLIWFALASGQIVMTLLVVLHRSILRWFRQFFPFDADPDEVVSRFSYQRLPLVGIALLYITLQFNSFWQVRQADWLPDSIDYIFPATTFKWTELGLWTHTKPWGAAVLYKLTGSSAVTIDAVQTTLSALAWLALAWIFSSIIRVYWLRVASFSLILGLGLAPSVQMWNHVIQSESLSISLMVLILAEWLSLLRHWRWAKLFTLIFFFAWWIGTRDTNIYIGLLVAGILILVGLLYKRQRFYLGISVLLIVFGYVNLQISEVPNIPRWLYPLTNTVLNRILPDEEFLSYFQARGLSVTPDLMALSGGLANSNDFAVFNSTALNDVEDWLYRKGKHTYIHFLLDHPLYTLTSPWLNIREMLAPTDKLDYAQVAFAPPLAWVFGDIVFINSLWLLAALVLLAIIAVLKANPWKSSAFWLLLVFLALFFPHIYLVWHGDASEVGRHAIQASVQLRLSLWLLFIIAVDTILLKQKKRSKHYGI